VTQYIGHGAKLYLNGILVGSALKVDSDGRMRVVPPLHVPPGATVTMKPGLKLTPTSEVTRTLAGLAFLTYGKPGGTSVADLSKALYGNSPYKSRGKKTATRLYTLRDLGLAVRRRRLSFEDRTAEYCVTADGMQALWATCHKGQEMVHQPEMFADHKAHLLPYISDKMPALPELITLLTLFPWDDLLPLVDWLYEHGSPLGESLSRVLTAPYRNWNALHDAGAAATSDLHPLPF
jgi:hypothetical protein